MIKYAPLRILSLNRVHTWLAVLVGVNTRRGCAGTGTALRGISSSDGSATMMLSVDLMLPEISVISLLLSATLALRRDGQGDSDLGHLRSKSSILGDSSTNLDGVGDEWRPVHPEKDRYVDL